jgi:hypothetical protein
VVIQWPRTTFSVLLDNLRIVINKKIPSGGM